MAGRCARWLHKTLPLALAVSSMACVTTVRSPSGENDKLKPADAFSRARVHTELGALYYEQGSLKTALDELDTAVKVDPDYAPALGMLGLVYMQLGEMPTAEKYFNRAIALAPRDPDLRNNFGWFLCDTANYQAGLAQLEMAWSNPLYATPGRALLNASRCVQRAGDDALASTYRQRAAAYGVVDRGVSGSPTGQRFSP